MDSLVSRTARHFTAGIRMLWRHAEPDQQKVGDRWFQVCTGMQYPLANMVAFAPEATEEDVDCALTDLQGDFPCVAVFEASELPDRTVRLVNRHGLAGPQPMPLMAAQIDQLEAVDSPSGVEVRAIPVSDCDAWCEATAAGFGMPPELGVVCGKAADDQTAHLFAAVEGGKVVATSLVFLYDGLAGIYSVATLPEARRRGIGAKVTAEPLRWAAERGYETAVLQSSPSGYSVYQKLGFEEIGSMATFWRSRRTEEG